MRKLFIKPLIFCTLLVLGHAEEPDQTINETLQNVLDSGEDLLLEPRVVYEISEPLVLKFEGQKIATRDAKTLSDYATLRIVNPELGQLINGNQVDGVVLENLILDGNRYTLSTVSKKIDRRALVFFGGNGAERQLVRRCVFLSPRTWSTLKVHEGGSEIQVVDNIFLNAGCDVRGNGREGTENPREEGVIWGDGISCAAEKTLVRNNIILDPTDVGMVFFGAPGSQSIGNVIATISRESLGGINLVDPLKFWAFEEDPTRINYQGVELRDNLIDAKGGRIHMAIPIGATPWVPANEGFTFVGGSVINNTISGGAAAYGIIATEIDDFQIKGNISTAQYSGAPDGLADSPADKPAAFLFDPAKIGTSQLQADFQPMRRHLNHLLRCNHGMLTVQKYKYYDYGFQEVKAVVTTAFQEMLGRVPTLDELAYHTMWLRETQGSSDQLRQSLLMSKEFVAIHGFVNPLDLQKFRTKLWFDQFEKEIGSLTLEDEWPSAREVYLKAWAAISQE